VYFDLSTCLCSTDLPAPPNLELLLDSSLQLFSMRYVAESKKEAQLHDFLRTKPSELVSAPGQKVMTLGASLSQAPSSYVSTTASPFCMPLLQTYAYSMFVCCSA